MSSSPGRSGLALIAVAAVLWAAIGWFTPALLQSGLTAVQIAFWRALLGGLLFAVHAASRTGLRIRARHDLGGLALFGAASVDSSTWRWPRPSRPAA